MNEATVVSRDYSSCTSSKPCFPFCPACVLFCCAVSMAQRDVTPSFDFTFLFQAPPQFAGSFTGHSGNTTVPYRRPPKLHFVNFHISQVYFQFFHNETTVIQRIRMYLRYDVRIHTNIACGLAQARPNYFVPVFSDS